MRKALATLPWVEQQSVETDIPRREVRFNLTDRGAFREADVRAALNAQGFRDVTVRAAPGKASGG